jgi:ADP-ribose pyrophosphatase YjhB (NUDIX family)
MEPGRTIAETIVREVREETGIEATVEKLLGVYSNPVTSPSTTTARCASSSRSAFCAALSAASLGTGTSGATPRSWSLFAGGSNVARATLESVTRFGKLHKSAERVRKLINP